jgi:predicted nicotinamide N-methyase
MPRAVQVQSRGGYGHRTRTPRRPPLNAREFIAAHTARGHAPLIPEITLRLASEITPIWQASEAWLAEHNMEPPFWAFAWPGGIATARHILDHPETLRGRRVLDFASGCGIAAIAAAMAGATVEAAEIDAPAIAAIALNADTNDVAITTLARDVVGEAGAWDVILAGDVCYEAPMTAHIWPWLLERARAGVEIWLADPGRAYLPREGLVPFARLTVPTSRELEDRAERHVTLFRLVP